MTIDGTAYTFPVEHPRKDPSVNAPAFFEFSDDGWVWGGAPCNGFSGTYEFDGDQLTWDMMRELFACADRSWNQAEDLMFGVFWADVTVRFSGTDPETMTMMGSTGHVILTLRRDSGS